MSFFGSMTTAITGIRAQSSALGYISDNIANSQTTGFKRTDANFYDIVTASSPNFHQPGAVVAKPGYTNTVQGSVDASQISTNMAINGDGFFIVQDASGTPVLTRAGAFVPDAQGRLVNAAGFQLMAYSYENGVPAATVNGFQGLEPVTITDQGMTATPSTNGSFSANLPAGATPVAAGDLPSANSATAQYTAKSSLVAYDNLGNKVLLDVYFTNTGVGSWQVSVFDQSKATPGTSFPYTGGALGSANLTFDTTTGQLTGATKSVSFTVPNGAPMTLDLSTLTQLGTGYTPGDAHVNGNAPSTIEKIEISKDGTIYALNKDGSSKALYKIPLADVTSPDQLAALAGNVYAQSSESGAVRIGFANEGKLGAIISGALENSDVDIAEELTSMIAAQRSYTANSKVFQTGSDLMDVLVNLKR